METKESKELRKQIYDAVMENLLKEGFDKEVADKTVEILDRLTQGWEYCKKDIKDLEGSYK